MKPVFIGAIVAAVVLGLLWWTRHQANKKKRNH
jgi:hypothetical protein